MLKCLNCHHLFDEEEVLTWEERHGFDWGMAEEFSACPYCGGSYEETISCDKCDGEFLYEELFEGICAECVINSINYDDFLALLIEDNFLDVFMFRAVLESPVPSECSEALLKELREIFLRRKADDQICGKTEFLDVCKKFVSDGNYGIDVSIYAEWLNTKKKEVTR